MKKFDSIALLQKLIRIPSFSKDEKRSADLIEHVLSDFGCDPERFYNNIWALSKEFDPKLPTLLLNSHHDTVKPGKGWSTDPFVPVISDGMLFGLGSNDAGGALVSLMSVFLQLFSVKLPFNIVFAATAEEEISGKGGIASIIDKIGVISMAIVGEPTQMKPAIAEKGLVVLDCKSKGKTGHAARSNGENAIYKAMQDIDWFQNFRFPKISPTLGEVHMNVTVINGGSQHNVIPDECTFVVDVRTTNAYTNEEIVELIRSNVRSEIQPRSLRLQSSGTSETHPLFKTIQVLGLEGFGSPTLSDQAMMPWDSIKMGPGKSERSHMTDEYIYLDEIEEGTKGYLALINELKNQL